MVSKLIPSGNSYACSNCRMIQSQLKPNCFFCGNILYNYEDIIIKIEEDKILEEIKEKKQNENNIR